jgi:hypothetical protein
MGAMARIVQFQPCGIRTERIGQEQIAARIDRAGIKRADLVLLRLIPKLWCVTAFQAHIEQVCPGRTVSQKPIALGKKVLQQL